MPQLALGGVGVCAAVAALGLPETAGRPFADVVDEGAGGGSAGGGGGSVGNGPRLLCGHASHRRVFASDSRGSDRPLGRAGADGFEMLSETCGDGVESPPRGRVDVTPKTGVPL